MAKYLDEILDTTFDSRDLIERFDELENDNTNDDGDIVFDDPDEAEEHRVLKGIIEEAEGYSGDFHFGVTFIRDDFFEEYAQEYAEDIGAIPEDIGWPANRIDWEAAANDLQMDYTSVEIQGDTYWFR